MISVFLQRWACFLCHLMYLHPPSEWQTRGEISNPQHHHHHHHQSGKHEEHISKIFPETKGTLSKIGKELRAAVDRISAKERHINKVGVVVDCTYS